MKRDDYSPGPLCSPVTKIYGLGCKLPKTEEEEAKEKEAEQVRAKEVELAKQNKKASIKILLAKLFNSKSRD